MATTALLAGCASGPLQPFAAEPLDVLHTHERTALPDGLQMDVDTEVAEGLRVGDCAAYSLRILDHDEERSWFVRIAVAAERENARGTGRLTHDEQETIELSLRGMARYHILVTDPGGAVLGESFTDPVPTELLRAGFGEACDYFTANRDVGERELNRRLRALPEDRRRAVLLSVLAGESLLTLVLDAEPLAPLVEAAVRRPSLLGVLGNLSGGVRASFEFQRARRWPEPFVGPSGSAWVLPLDVTAFGERALAASMVMTEPEPPLQVCIGLLGVAAVHPDDDQLQVQMQLQATGRLRDEERRRVTIAALTEAVDRGAGR